MQVRAAIRSFTPREIKVLEQDPKLNRKLLMKNIRRVSSQIEAIYAALQFVNSLFQWTNYLHSSVAFVVSYNIASGHKYLFVLVHSAVVCGVGLIRRLVDAIYDASVDICVQIYRCWHVFTTDKRNS